MLELHLPHPMPHAVPRERRFDMYSSSRPASKLDSTHAVRQMQLPVPNLPLGHAVETLRTTSGAPLTPPSDLPGSAVRVVSLPPANGAPGLEYGYQLPAIGNSRTASTRVSPAAQRQPQQNTQDVAQRKKWSISPNLRIPASISTPQEGLPQLAAEVSAPTV